MRLGTYVFVPEPEVPQTTTTTNTAGQRTAVASVQYCVGGANSFCAQVPLFQSNPTTGSTTNSTGTPSNIPKFNFTTNLRQGSSGASVRELQRFLNAIGFTVARVGAGSSGRETNTFGNATRNALARFQKANNITPAVGFFGPVTRDVVGRVMGTGKQKDRRQEGGHQVRGSGPRTRAGAGTEVGGCAVQTNASIISHICPRAGAMGRGR